MNPPNRRRFLLWLNVTVMILLMAAFLVGVNLIAHARFARIDMTTDKVWEISDQSRQILKSVSRQLEIYFNPVGPNLVDQDKAMPEAWRRAQLLLVEMANQNSKIQVWPIVPNSQAQARVASLVGMPEPNMIYFVYRTPDDKPLTRAMTITDLYVSNPQSGEVTDFFGESRIITAIANLISDRKIKIYCVEGHKEIPINAPERRGSLTVLGARLTALENVEFKPLDLGRVKSVPDDADLVFIAGPAHDYSTIETDALRQYWVRGGRLFVATYPVTPDPMEEFRKFLESVGVRLNRDIVVDAAREMGDSGVILVQRYAKHPVNLNQVGMDYRVAFTSSVDAQVVRKNMQSMPLFFSSEKCWTETDLPPTSKSRHTAGERWGPIPLAVASEEAVGPQKFARIVAWGGVSALTNELNLVQDRPNDLTLSYIVNNIRWLVDREMLVAPKPSRQPRMRPFAPPAGADSVIGWISLGVIPFLGVALGGLAWYFRRK